jgi:hypothetical protein
MEPASTRTERRSTTAIESAILRLWQLPICWILPAPDAIGAFRKESFRKLEHFFCFFGLLLRVKVGCTAFLHIRDKLVTFSIASPNSRPAIDVSLVGRKLP